MSSLEPQSQEEEDAQLAEALAASLAFLQLEDVPGVEPEPEPRLPAPVVVNVSVAVHLGAEAGRSRPQSPAADSLPEGRGDQDALLEADWPARRARARQAGEMARRRMDGAIGAVPATPALRRPLRNRVYAVLRCREGVDARGVYAGPWHAVRGLVEERGQLAPEAVFHGFPSLREAEEYWTAATGDAQVPRLHLPRS